MTITAIFDELGMADVKVSRIIGLFLALLTITISFSILAGMTYTNIKIDNSSFEFDTNNPSSLEEFAYSLFDISSVLSATVVVLVSIYFCFMLDQ